MGAGMDPAPKEANMATLLIGAAWVAICLEFWMVFRHRRNIKIWMKINRENGNEE